MDKIINKIAEELSIKNTQVEAAIKLIDDGNTIPFIARYRKEATGNLSDEVLRDLDERLNYLRNLEKRKEEIIRLIDEQGKLTPELQSNIENAMILSELEDIYRPYKPKKRTRATIAKERGLEPLAVIIMQQDPNVDIYEDGNILQATFKNIEKREAFINNSLRQKTNKIKKLLDIRTKLISALKDNSNSIYGIAKNINQTKDLALDIRESEDKSLTDLEQIEEKKINKMLKVLNSGDKNEY